MSSGLTQAQTDALSKAWELLKEHFDSAILAYETEVPEGTERAYAAFYSGGTTTAIGLCEKTKYRLLEEGRRDEEDES